jgi:ubiquinone/menaquinone biosynthesis C-methylase UbiE
MRAFEKREPLSVPSMLAALWSRRNGPEAGVTPTEAMARSYDFNRIAAKYDDWYRGPVGRVYDVLEKRAIGGLLPDPSSGNRFLELGCGTGHWSAFFAERGFHVTGLDISARMVQVAREKQIPKAKFYQADAAAIPLPDDSFDVVGAITLLEFVGDPRKVLAEMARCVRDGGCIVVGVLNRWSYQGIARKLQRTALFRSARFFSLRVLRKLLAEYGPAQVRSTAFFLPWQWALAAAPVLDWAASLVRLPFGDFLAGRVQR